MTGLSLQFLTKTFGNAKAVDEVTLEIAQGSFVCLLGPSGCGKTTLLRMIAGLEEPTAGRVVIDGEDVTQTPTHKRNFGMVFQSLALFPHLDVAGNIAYPMTIRGVPRAEARTRVTELLELVRLPGMADRPVARLSGGQRQRVAIARALALSPRLFLLDEPLSALDAKLREAMQVELRQLQQRLGITTIVVTHDQREAMTMADLVVVMGGGRVHQAAPPVEIYRRPADAFVADFIGSTNLIPIRAGKVLGAALPGLPEAGTLSVRPEDLEITGPEAAPLRARVAFVRDLGATVETFLEVDGLTLTAVASPRARPHAAIGAEVGLRFDPAAMVVLAA
ncbi:MAG TPA: ABC transporter ATP-binding protein [Paracoccaceae bacterium]|nr:ABC transporter ATP-binding protein [Paracoccaceae bacterium]